MTPVSMNTAAAAPVTGPGKSAQSVGHQAKQAIALAREAGADLPKNAQGMAASAIARGADPASVFAAQIAAAQPVEDTAPVADTGDTAPAGDDTALVEAAVAAFEFNAPAISTSPLDTADTALQLLDTE